MPTVKLEELGQMLQGSLQAQLLAAEQAVHDALGADVRLLGAWPDRVLVLQGESFAVYRRAEDGAIGRKDESAVVPRILSVQDEARELRQELRAGLLALQRGDRARFEESVALVAAVVRPEHLD